MRLAFMGTPDFAVHALDALAAAGHEIAAVYTQPPRPAGRGGAPRPTPVALAGERLGLEVRSPLNFRDPEDRAAFAALDLDAAIVVAYGLILPQAVLSAPRLGCLNAHASLLPRWRGAAPIQRAIMAGDAETGVCVMGMEAGLDTGPVFARAATPIAPDETAETLHDRLAGIAAKLLVATLPQVADGATPEPQDADGAIYAPKIDKAEARIDWTRPAAEVDRAIRGLSPFPGAWFERDGARIKALLSQVEAGAGAPGEALDDAGLIACGEGAVRLLRLQKAGRGPLPATDFLRGTPLAAGTSLG